MAALINAWEGWMSKLQWTKGADTVSSASTVPLRHDFTEGGKYSYPSKKLQSLKRRAEAAKVKRALRKKRR